MFGPFDYNTIPLGPIGCAVLIHENTNTRANWDNHAVYIWYLQTSSEHYREHVFRVKKTNTERVLDTVIFQHKHITNPTTTHDDNIIRAIRNL